MKTESKLMDNADDSSDEEDESIVLNTTEILEKWEEFESDKFFSDIKSLVEDPGNRLRNFFFVLYLGIGLFHAPSVQANYRDYKKKYLAKNYLETSETSLKNAIKEAIIASIFQMFRIESFKENERVNRILKAFIENNINLIDQIVNELMANQRQLFRGTRIPSALEANFQKLELIRNKLLEVITRGVVISYRLIQDRVYLTYNGNHKLINDCITEEIFKEIKELVEQAFDEIGGQTELQALHEYLKKLEDKSANGSGKEDEGEDESEEVAKYYDEDLDALQFKQLQIEVLKILNGIEENLTQDELGTDDDPRVNLTVQDFIGQNKKALLVAKFNDINNQETYNESLDTCLWQLVNNSYIREETRSQLKEHLGWSAKRKEACLRKNLNSEYYYLCIAENLRQRIDSKLSRSFLSRNHIFNPTNEITFLSNLRASNRSQLRMIRHLIATEQKGGDLIRLKWLLAKTLTYEDQEISDNLARLDLVTPLGAYASIWKKINELESNLNCDDAYIAKMIRDILSGKSDVFKDFAVNHEKKTKYELIMVSLTYLLFGTEVVRNPGSLILQQMMLDLIIAGKMSWEEALNNKELAFGGGGYMPMSMNEEPVASCRWLVNIFSKHLPRLYRYAGEAQSLENKGLKSIKELLRRNMVLIDMWLEYESKRLNRTPIISSEDIIDSIIGKIKNDWFKNISEPLEKEPDEIVINDSDLEEADKADHGEVILEFEDSNEETDEDNEQNSGSESSTDYSY